jgi:hypothetical protein
MKKLRLSVFFLLCIFSPWLGLCQSESTEKPKDAYIRILNCCDTDQEARWKTGLDLKFKGEFIGRDIRIGRQGPLGKIEFVGRDNIEVFRTENPKEAIAKIPATLKPGGFYTILVLGNLAANASDVKLKLIEEFPVPETDLIPGMVRMQLVNAVKNYPTALNLKANAPAAPPKYGEVAKIFLPIGEVKMDLIYRGSGSQIVSIPWTIETSNGEDYVGVIHPSRHRSDTPTFSRINVATSRDAILNPPVEEDESAETN